MDRHSGVRMDACSHRQCQVELNALDHIACTILGIRVQQEHSAVSVISQIDRQVIGTESKFTIFCKPSFHHICYVVIGPGFSKKFAAEDCIEQPRLLGEDFVPGTADESNMSFRPCIPNEPKGIESDDEIANMVKFQQKNARPVVWEPYITTDYLNVGIGER